MKISKLKKLSRDLKETRMYKNPAKSRRFIKRVSSKIRRQINKYMIIESLES